MNKLKFSLLATIGIMLISLISPLTNVSADEAADGISDGKITITKDTENTLEYIHEKENEVFKVVEDIDSETGNIDSKIYKKNNSDQYELYEEQTVRTNKNNDVTVENMFTNGEKNKLTFKSEQSLKESKDSLSSDEEVSPLSGDLTPWLYSQTVGFYEKSLLGLTISAVQTILDNTIGIPGWGNALIDAAVWIVENNQEEIYINKKTYYKNEVGTTILAGTKEITTLYKTSNMDYEIPGGHDVLTECATGYDCS